MRYFLSFFTMLSLASMVGCPETVQVGEVSDCGGFSGTREFAITDHGHDGMRDYCDAQVLYWQYADGTLTILDSRVLLNCCGQHSVSIVGGETISIHEQDDPEPGAMRCDCRCAYDFRAELDGLMAGPVEMELLLHVTDVTDEPTELWSGTVDLADGSGEIVIDASPEPDFCE
jgi:hypothetical protein